jgi:hypothetical protein
MTPLSKRPRTLHEVSHRVAAGEQAFDPAVLEFLDTFYSCPEERQDGIAREPLPLGDLRDAYLSAVAEHLALSFGLSVPEWSDTHGTPLKMPFFAGGLDSLKALLFVQSPTAFRRRLLFISKDSLSRPRPPEPPAS